jgi:hypothetical protein
MSYIKIIAGIYPIAQLQEPYTTVGYLAQWLPIVKILKLGTLENDTMNYSALDICEGEYIRRSWIAFESTRLSIYVCFSLIFLSMGNQTWIFHSQSIAS